MKFRDSAGLLCNSIILVWCAVFLSGACLPFSFAAESLIVLTTSQPTGKTWDCYLKFPLPCHHWQIQACMDCRQRGCSRRSSGFPGMGLLLHPKWLPLGAVVVLSLTTWGCRQDGPTDMVGTCGPGLARVVLQVCPGGDIAPHRQHQNWACSLRAIKLVWVLSQSSSLRWKFHLDFLRKFKWLPLCLWEGWDCLGVIQNILPNRCH